MPYPQNLDSFTTKVDFSSLVVAADMNGVQNSIVTLEQYGAPAYNVRTYGGAKGDGFTDDTTAIQICLDAARNAGGGTVFVPPGTYIVRPTPHPNGTYNTALTIGNGVILRGAGRDAVTIRMIGGSTSVFNQAAVITNYILLPGTPDSVVIEDLTVDGNGGAMGGVVDRQMGIFLNRARNCHINRVKVINTAGSNSGGNGPNGTLGEGFGFEAQLCHEIFYNHCQYYGNYGASAVSTATINTLTTGGGGGFSADQSTDIFYTSCIAMASAQAHGFTHWLCQNIKYVNCHSYLNRFYGFNSEAGTTGTSDVQYTNCQAGGFFVTSTGGLIPPFASGQSLGNGGRGFRISGSLKVLCDNCISRKNLDHGFHAELNATGTWIGGMSADNGNYGFNFDTIATAQGFRITGGPILTGNSLFLVINSTNQSSAAAFGPMVAPTVPASGTALTSPFPFDAVVYIVGGTVTGISVDGFATGLTATPATVRVAAGHSITLTYSAVPTWKWLVD